MEVKKSAYLFMTETAHLERYYILVSNTFKGNYESTKSRCTTKHAFLQREKGQSILAGLEISHLQRSLLQKKVNQTASYFSSSEVLAVCSTCCICFLFFIVHYGEPSRPFSQDSRGFPVLHKESRLSLNVLRLYSLI